MALGLSLALALALADAKQAVCASPTTLDSVACLELEVAIAQRCLDAYIVEVRTRIRDELSDLQAFERANASWLSFIEIDCQAIYQHWIEGSIRGSMYLSCKLDHIETRGDQLWSTYLRHTVTDLPEPDSLRELCAPWPD